MVKYADTIVAVGVTGRCLLQFFVRGPRVLLTLFFGLIALAVAIPASAHTASPSEATQATKTAQKHQKAQPRQSAKTKKEQASAKKRQASAKKRQASAKKKQASAKVARKPRDPNDRMSAGSKLGLQSAMTEASLKSSAVLVIDQISGEVLFEKNPDSVLPIASITKLMTALVVAEADLPMTEMLAITKEDADLEKGVGSRLRVGTRLNRGELMHLALMSSENRAAHALGRTYPGGMEAFVDAMNIKAQQLGMASSRFTEPTGLNAGNISTPRDLVRLVEESFLVPLIREYSTSQNLLVRVGKRSQQFRNSNALVRTDSWDLGLSKTGFIREAGRCLVMQAEVEKRPVILVMLDAPGTQHRLRDAEMIRRWLMQQAEKQLPAAKPPAA
ncbi:MAG: serine hydrolase [Burkholderiaceae bacterium]|nr:serine hydrolase [Burkholderiaceae bacterium]